MKTEKNIFIAFILNLIFSIIEFIGGTIINSVSIMSDAIHDMGDALSIGISFLLEKISKKKPDNKYTYGYVRYSVMGSLVTTVILLLGSVLVIYNAINRIINPVSINYNGMIMLGLLGIIVNIFAVYFTREGKSLNQKVVNLHMLEDVLGWLVVLIGAIVMKFTDITVIDPILSIFVALFILKNALSNFKSIIDLFLVKIPNDVNLDELKKHILNVKGVNDVHHIHIWSIDGYNNYATMHIVTDNLNIKNEVKEELKNHGISHSTIEIETSKDECEDKICKNHQKINVKHNHNHK